MSTNQALELLSPGLDELSRSRSRDVRLDAAERWIIRELTLVDQPLEHTFAGDLYIRAVVNPVDSLVITKVHKTAHPFFVLRGMALVSTDDGPPIEITAPYFGVTQPGTRRAILAIKEVTWMTVHAMTPAERDEPDQAIRLQMIEARIIEPRTLDDEKTSHQLFWEQFNRQLQAQETGPVKEIPE